MKKTNSKNTKVAYKEVDFFKARPEVYWLFADKWFRVLEFFILLSVLNYFRQKTGDMYVTILLFISYAIFLGWFLEFQEHIFDKISGLVVLSKREKILVDILIFIVFIFINIIVFRATSIMTSK